MARGYGLVDDTDPAAWRERPAFAMLAQWLGAAGPSRFVEKLATPPGTHVFLFEKPDGVRMAVGYSAAGPAPFSPPFAYRRLRSAAGAPAGDGRGRVELTGSPVYFEDVSR